MKLLTRLERKFGDFAIPNLTLCLVVMQAFTWFLLQAKPQLFNQLVLTHDALMRGEVWRLVTPLFIPPAFNLLFLFIALYMFFIFGSALEGQWGHFRYNLFFFVGYMATILTVFIPGSIVTAVYLMESVFLAFAWLFPEFEILLFFILPVKVKWLGLLAWISYLYFFIVGPLPEKAQVAAGALNFVLFFHADLWDWARTSRRRFQGNIRRAKAAQDAEKPMHVCNECGVSDKSDKTMEFRYCPLCTGTPAYCINHIHNHRHR